MICTCKLLSVSVFIPLKAPPAHTHVCIHACLCASKCACVRAPARVCARVCVCGPVCTSVIHVCMQHIRIYLGPATAHMFGFDWNSITTPPQNAIILSLLKIFQIL